LTRALLPVALAALSGACTDAPPPAPGKLRIVSINPCVDAVLAQVADAATIAGISHYSQDPRSTSVPLAWARRFPATSGTAEEVVALRPSLVIAGPHVQPATLAALQRMRIAVAQLPVPESVSASVGQVRAIAALAGHAERGDALARAIEAAAAPVGGPSEPALIWQSGGLVPGKGTLADELLARAGYRNMSAAYGLQKWDVLPLEYLIARPPAVLFSVAAAEQSDDRVTSHPAVRRLARHIRLEAYPSRLLNCGGPTIIDAMARLKAARGA